MIYYSPAAGFDFNAKFVARMFEIDNITAIKWTSSNYYGLTQVKELTHGEMNLINGPDEMLLMGLNAGADGGIGTTYNFMFDTIKSIYDNFNDYMTISSKEMFEQYLNDNKHYG
jgi:N-acetylneuraminate lyase